MQNTPWAQVAARTYCGGDFRDFTTMTEIARSDLASCGDGLFRFLMIELSTEEGCNSRCEAIRRCESAVRDLGEIVRALIVVLDGEDYP